MTSAPIPDRAAAERHLARVCFKTGPPRLTGVELEWTVHHADDPARPLTRAELSAALAEHAPPLLAPAGPYAPLRHGGVITVEPGGQVEISAPPCASQTELITNIGGDIEQLRQLLARRNLALGESGCDPHRPPNRIIDHPRYAAMEAAFDKIGPDGRVMMCSTAGLQVCIDVGTPEQAATRWNAAHALGPVLLAAFAGSPRHAGRHTGWASSRMRAWYGTDPVRTLPPQPRPTPDSDPISAWARRILDTPLLCLRRPGNDWCAPAGVTFAGWIGGALTGDCGLRPTYEDLDYHASTLFPPVRARPGSAQSYLELRYLDAQPGDGWMVPIAAVTALFASDAMLGRAVQLAEPAADRWEQAARDGLADPVIARQAPQVLGLAAEALGALDLPGPLAEGLAERLVRIASRVAGEVR